VKSYPAVIEITTLHRLEIFSVIPIGKKSYLYFFIPGVSIALIRLGLIIVVLVIKLISRIKDRKLR